MGSVKFWKKFPLVDVRPYRQGMCSLNLTDIAVNNLFPSSVLLRGGRNRNLNVLFVACLRQPEANETDFPNHIDTKRVVSHTRKPPT